MWAVRRVDWPKAVIDAARNHELVLVIGNGLSRLSGAPSWTQLFKLPGPRNQIRRSGALSNPTDNFSASMLDIAEIVHENRAAWNEVIAEIISLNRNLEPNLVHHLLAQSLGPRAVATTNFDNLLTRVGLDPTYLHGVPDDPQSWVLTSSAYRSSLQHTTNLLKNCSGRGTLTLFVGYGHSRDDYDIASAWRTGRNMG